MVVEGNRTAGFKPLGYRLSDVMQQGSQPENQVLFEPVILFVIDCLHHHGQGVLINILVVVVLISLKLESRQFGQHQCGNSRVNQSLKPRTWVV